MVHATFFGIPFSQLESERNKVRSLQKQLQQKEEESKAISILVQTSSFAF
jgi:hypothetical protein